MVPQLPSFTVAEQNSKFTARCIISFTGGCPGAIPQQRSSNRSSLQIIGCSFFHWNARGARLTHDARSRRVFGTARRLGRRCTAGQKREARYCGDQANGFSCVFKLHKRRRSGPGWYPKSMCAHSFRYETLGLREHIQKFAPGR
jgi:hypothetical protein